MPNFGAELKMQVRDSSSKFRRKTVLAAILIVALAGLFGLQALHGSHVLRISSASSGGPGLIVPLYSYPGWAWQSLISAREQYPSVPVIAVINPSGGPGSYQDSNILSGVQQLQSAGITVLGYIDTGYASISLKSVESQAYDYHAWYGLSGVFLDEMWNQPGYEWYYADASNYVNSNGMWLTVGNPGAPVTSGYIGTCGIIITYENAGLPSVGTIASWTSGYSRSGFGVISYNDGYPSSWYVSQLSQYVNWMYFTDDYQYGALSSYTKAMLSDFNGGSSGGGGGGGGSGVSVTVNTVDQSGSQISGLWTVIYSSSGAVLQSGFSPLTFDAVAGTTYQVSVSDYGQYLFGHWSTGSTSRLISITPSSSTTLTAYYGSSSGGGGAVPTSRYNQI